jgi:surface polysaccharide O-acyltransferase-like enzyme
MRSVDILEAKPATAGLETAELPLAGSAAIVERRTAAVRLANVERLRLIAMFEIVAFHVSEQRLPIIAGLGLPTFLLLNNAFNCTLSERMGSAAFLRIKVSRLLMPWLVWSVVYGAVLVLERLRHDEPLVEGFSAWMIIGGTYDHLWFVPFALFGGVLVAWLQATTRQLPDRAVVLASLMTGSSLAALVAFIFSSFSIDWPALQWLFALPSPVLGFAVGRAVLGGDRKLIAQTATLACIAALGCWALSTGLTVPEVVTRYATSLGVLGLAFMWPGQADGVSQRLTPLLFGIYLVHPLILRMYLASHLPIPPVTPFAALVFVAAALVVVGLRRTPLRRLV